MMSHINLRRTTSLTLMFNAAILTYTGIVLYFSPPGRVAQWSDWHFLGLNREELIAQHTLFAFLFVVLGLLHTVYNWKPIVAYLRNKVGAAVRFNGNLVLAVGLSLLVAVGTYLGWTPFGEVMTLGGTLKESWEAKVGSAPYAHAERDTLAQFAEKTGISPQQIAAALVAQNIAAAEGETLLAIAERHQVSPQALFALMPAGEQGSARPTTAHEITTAGLTSGIDAEQVERVFGAGSGKRTLAELASLANLSVEQALAVLAVRGVRAESRQTMKEIGQNNGLNAPEVAALLLPR